MTSLLNLLYFHIFLMLVLIYVCTCQDIHRRWITQQKRQQTSHKQNRIKHNITYYDRKQCHNSKLFWVPIIVRGNIAILRLVTIINNKEKKIQRTFQNLSRKEQNIWNNCWKFSLTKFYIHVFTFEVKYKMKQWFKKSQKQQGFQLKNVDSSFLD